MYSSSISAATLAQKSEIKFDHVLESTMHNVNICFVKTPSILKISKHCMHKHYFSLKQT